MSEAMTMVEFVLRGLGLLSGAFISTLGGIYFGLASQAKHALAATALYVLGLVLVAIGIAIVGVSLGLVT